ncbi:MAG: riboflavin synthase [Ginsengibacter sp.]
MFTGIIESLGTIQEVTADRTNRIFWIKSDLSSQLKIDESLSHSGVCLTVEETTSKSHRVTAILETLDKTNAGGWKAGDIINLERSLRMNGRIDGHIVQGHVDGTTTCISINDRGGSTEFTFSYDQKYAALLIEKGSICLNGVSLTVFDVSSDTFKVAIIPYTFEHTNFYTLNTGNVVNIEFDILGKYVERMLKVNGVK